MLEFPSDGKGRKSRRCCLPGPCRLLLQGARFPVQAFSSFFFVFNFLVGAELSVVQMISRTRQTEYEKFMAESKVKELQQDNGTKAIPSKST